MQVIYMKRGSLWPKLQATINIQRDTNLTGCTVAVRIRPQEVATYVTYSCTILDAAAGTVEYQWQAGNTDVAGVFWLEFWITVPSVGTMIVPDDHRINLTITDNIS